MIQPNISINSQYSLKDNDKIWLRNSIVGLIKMEHF